MISFNIKCAKEHVFEAWFKDGKSYERQAKQGRISCPFCGDTKVEKAPMAPNIASGVSRMPKSEVTARAAAYRAMLHKLKEEIEKNCDYVGSQFAEEARKIHYKESEQRSIYGEATDQEAKALQEEGIEFSRIPWPSRSDS